MRLPELPKRPIRSLFRFTGRVIVEVVRTWLDLDNPRPQEPTKPRPAKSIRRGDSTR